MAFRLRSPLKSCGSKTHSENDEDGIIQAIFSDIQPRSQYFVEFGIGPNWQDPEYTRGIEGNCVLLRNSGWQGLFMDGAHHPEQHGIRSEHVTALNINGLLRKYGVPEDVDIISIDVDSQDFWIWMACYYRPTLYIVEYNPNFPQLRQSMTMVFDPAHQWDGTKYYGASLGAMVKLGTDKGYKLVYANGVNAFFVRSDMLANPEDFGDEDLLVFVDRHAIDRFCRHWVSI